jgi:hypothetical protein
VEPSDGTAEPSDRASAQSLEASKDVRKDRGPAGRGARNPALVAAGITGRYGIAAGILAGVFGLFAVHLASANGKPNGAATTPSASAHPAASACPPATKSGEQRRHGRLVLLGNGTAYDLDSCAQDWDPSAGEYWIAQNIAYAPTGDHGHAVLQIAGSPGPDVVMNGKGPWTFADCASAPYYANNSPTGPEVVTGAALDKGRGICVETRDTHKTNRGGPKTDGNHIVLLVVLSRTVTTLTLEVTVWQE